MPAKIKAKSDQQLRKLRDHYISQGYKIATATESSYLLEGGNKGKLGSTVLAAIGVAMLLFAPAASLVLWIIAGLNYMLAGKEQIYISFNP